MEFDLHPSVTLRTGTFSAVIAPEECVLAGMNTSRVLRRFLFLYLCGDSSRLLQGIDRSSVQMEVRRAVSVSALTGLIRGAYHTIIFAEHDPAIYEGDEEAMDRVADALHAAGERALVALYAPVSDPSFERLSRKADRVFHITPVWPLAAAAARKPARIRHPSATGIGQTTLEGI